MVDTNSESVVRIQVQILIAYSVPSTILGAGKTVVNEIKKVFALRAYIPWGMRNNKQIDFHIRQCAGY